MEPQTTPTNPDILTPGGLVDWLGVGEKWVQKNTQARRIPGQFKAGKYWRYRRAEIEKQILKTGQALLPKAKR